MAQNFCESSSLIPIPQDKIEQAKEIVMRISNSLEEEEGYTGYDADVTSVGETGVWIRHDDAINSEHAHSLVQALVEELDLPDIVVCSWAYTCSKPGIDEFGGGAFAVQKGHSTIWIDAASEALRQAEALKASCGNPPTTLPNPPSEIYLQEE